MTRRTGADATGRARGPGRRGNPARVRRPGMTTTRTALRPCWPCSRWRWLMRAAPAARGLRRAVVAAGGPGLPDGLVLRVAHVGGFVTPEITATRLPLVSVYADGRVITEGPVSADLPGAGPAQRAGAQIDGAVQDLVERALAAGVGRDRDSARPVADAPSTRFTLVTAEGTYVREVYALGEPREGNDGGLTPSSSGPRPPCSDLVDALDAGGPGCEPGVRPDAVAAVVSGRGPTATSTRAAAARLAWPGPALPGEPLAAGLGLSCLTDRGRGAAVLDAAAGGNARTPWVARTAPAGRSPSARCCPTRAAAPTSAADPVSSRGPGRSSSNRSDPRSGAEVRQRLEQQGALPVRPARPARPGRAPRAA